MKKLRLLIITLVSAGFLTSCMSIKEIPLEKTPAQIIQMGQDAETNGFYKSAVLCFNTAVDRYGSDPAVYAEARYELANVLIKQKKYEPAYTILEELLNIYDYYPSALPPAYKKLANIAMNKIPEKKLDEIRRKKALEGATKIEDETVKTSSKSSEPVSNDYSEAESEDDFEEDFEIEE